MTNTQYCDKSDADLMRELTAARARQTERNNVIRDAVALYRAHHAYMSAKLVPSRASQS